MQGSGPHEPSLDERPTQVIMVVGGRGVEVGCTSNLVLTPFELHSMNSTTGDAPCEARMWRDFANLVKVSRGFIYLFLNLY